jgi:membrane protein required for colicin V production
MTTLDWIVLMILGASVVFGLIRGLIGEIFSLAAWVVAFLAAQWGAAAIGPWLPLDVQSEGMRYFVGFVAVFLAAMIVMMLLGRLAKGTVGAFGLGGVDKAVGGVFGLLRGLVILTGLTLAAGLTALPQTDFWKNALSSRVLELLAGAVEPLLPASLVEHIHFNR